MPERFLVKVSPSSLLFSTNIRKSFIRILHSDQTFQAPMLSKTNSTSLKITHLRNVVNDIEKQLQIAKDLLRELEEPAEIAKSVTIVDLCQENETQPSVFHSPIKTKKLTLKQRREQGKIYGRAWYLEEKARQLRAKAIL